MNVDTNRPWRRIGVSVLVAPLAALSLAACGSSSTSAGTDPGGSPAASGSAIVKAAQAQVAQLTKTPTSIPKLPALSSPAPTGGSHTFVFLNQPNVNSVVSVGEGAKQAAQALGWNYKTIDYDASNPASLQQALTSALTKHPIAVGIVGSPVSQFGQSVISTYQAAKVPIIAAAVTPIKPGSEGTVLTIKDNDDLKVRMGEVTANWAIADSNGTANVLLLHVTGFDSLDAYVKGFNDLMAKCSGCKVDEVNATLADVENGSINSIVVSKLRQNPDIKYLAYDEADWSTGINSALNAAGLNGIKIAGEDPTSVSLSALASNTQSAWSAHSLPLSGYFMIDQALRGVEGMTPAPTNVDDVPVMILTPSNVEGRTSFSDPKNALSQFETLWKVKG